MKSWAEQSPQTGPSMWVDQLSEVVRVQDNFAEIYEPPAEIIQAIPDPDPLEFRKSAGYNDHMDMYLARTDKTINDLTWTERYLLSQGILPEIKYLACAALVALIAAKERERQSHKTSRELRVISGTRAGEILELLDIPGSKSQQKHALVDVGSVVDESGNETDERDIRQIVCAGTDVLQPGNKVIVALPGARTIDNKKVRRRHFNIDGKRWESDGVLLSRYEAALTVKDRRLLNEDQVAILPNGTPVGVSLDKTTFFRDKYGQVAVDSTYKNSDHR